MFAKLFAPFFAQFSIPDWFQPTLALLPMLLVFFVVVGMPFALSILPRSAWKERWLVMVASMGLSPALITIGMFFIGTFPSAFGKFSVVNVGLATLLIALIGFAILSWKIRRSAMHTTPISIVDKLTDSKLTALDWILIVLIGVAILSRFWNTAYFPYTTYDEFWVYGQNGQLFMLKGEIPRTMGYYPQLVPLSYTFMQLFWGGINPHAARVVVPAFAAGSILMAYILGSRGFSAILNRRIGLLTAAIWALYPQHAIWSQFGDLEVPMTFYFTGVAAFFLIAYWRKQRAYAGMAGLLLGAALWTKPTAGALVWSGLLIAMVGTIWGVPRITWGSIQQTTRRLWSTPIVGDVVLMFLVGAPIGGMWYIRNVLMGLPPLVFPAGYWQDAAQRSGAELGWIIVLAAVFALYAILRRERAGYAGIGLVILVGCSLPSAFNHQMPDITTLGMLLIGHEPIVAPSRFGIEAVGVIIALVFLIWAAVPTWKRMESPQRKALLLIGLFIVPYWVTWFWSYSYHYRLSFPIVPLQIALIAGLLGSLIPSTFNSRPSTAINREGASSVTAPRGFRHVLNGSLIVLTLVMSLPGIFGTLSALPFVQGNRSDIALNDDAKITVGNPALMGLVNFLREQRVNIGRPLHLSAPNELRLPYFFPEDDIRTTDYPTQLAQIADLDYFIDSSPGQRLYYYQGILTNQILRSLTRETVMKRVFTIDDGNFRFSVYTIDNASRFKPFETSGLYHAEVGDIAEIADVALSNLTFPKGGDLFWTNYWIAHKPSDREYSVFMHLWDPVKQKLVASWGGQPVSGGFSVWDKVPGEHFSVAYPTTLWEKGELIKDEWKLKIPDDIPSGKYELHVGLFDPATGERLPVHYKDGTVRDYLLVHIVTILP